MGMAAEEANQHLVDQLITQGALWSRPLIEAFWRTPRHRFLRQVWHYQRQAGGWRELPMQKLGRAELRLLYSDRALTTRLSEAAPGLPPVPISSSSQPSLMAAMLEDMQLRRGLRVLEIGTGTGYNAALLAYVVGRVVSLEVDRRVLAEAAQHLSAFPDRQVELRHSDGRLGCPDEAPFDRILVTAAGTDVEPAWVEQLADDGLLVTPLDLAPGLAYLACGRRQGNDFEGQLTRPAYFMPLRGEADEHGSNVPVSSGLLPAPEPLPTVAAPWADWGERRLSCAGPGLLPSLAFLGWLHSYAVGYHVLPDGRPLFGVADLVHGQACWLGSREWRVTGMAGRRLGDQLWHTFLDAGGPWPTEFRLRAEPLDQASTDNGQDKADVLLHFERRGSCCRQHWTLEARRERPVSS